MKISFQEQEAIKNLSSCLKKVLEESMEVFKNVPEEKWHHKPAVGRWSKKEVLGHLIDSAANNHQRFVRIQHVNPLCS